MARSFLVACALLLASGGAVACSGGGTQVGPAPAPTDTAPSTLLPPRIRRLTTAEYDATVKVLLGTEKKPGAALVPDARLHKFAKFERNQAQVVDPMLARQLEQAALDLAKEYTGSRLDNAWPCAISRGDEACARKFFEAFLPVAYRRPVTPVELSELFSVVVLPSLARDGFHVAVETGIAAILQSPSFLYHTELGAEGAAKGVVTLTNAEIAAQMAYLLTGGPADAALTMVDLALPENRDAQARRLLESTGAREQVRRLIKQWLDIDLVGRTTKDKTKFPEYQPHGMDSEISAFIDEVVWARGGDFRLLFSADFTVGTSELSAFYGAPPPSTEPGVIDLSGTPRRGILNLGAFLAMYATPYLPSPVRRGARFLTQALCIDPGDPNALDARIALPAENPTKTTRERFEEHGRGTCAGCHEMIDSVGFTFGHFDAAGGWEENEDDDPERPIDSATLLRLPEEIPFGSQPVADSAELMLLTSESEVGRRCFARNMARFTAAAVSEDVEGRFLAARDALAATGNESVSELLVAYVVSDAFVQRDPKGGPK